MLLLLKALDRDLLIQAGDHNVAVAGFGGVLHGQQIAIQNAGITHAVAADAEQVIGTSAKQGRVHLVLCDDMLQGQDWLPCGHAPNQWQGLGGDAGVVHNNAARGAALQAQGAFAGQCFEVIAGRRA